MVRNLSVLAAVLLCAMGAPYASGQTVQLPSFQRFSVNTSVLAPDRGAAHLGGVSRSARRSSRYGVPGAGKLPGLGRLLGNRSIERSSSTGGASVHVTVIDHESLDRAVLAEAKRRRAGRSTLSPDVADLSLRLGDNVASGASAGGGLMSVAEIRRQNTRRKEVQQQEVLRLLTRGTQAEAKGSFGAAKIFYQMAYRRADSERQTQIAARLKRLGQRHEKPRQAARE